MAIATRDPELEQMIDEVSAYLVGQDTEGTRAFDTFDQRIKGEQPANGDDVLAALLAGSRSGSKAVLRAWLQESPASLLRFYARGCKA